MPLRRLLHLASMMSWVWFADVCAEKLRNTGLQLRAHGRGKGRLEEVSETLIALFCRRAEHTPRLAAAVCLCVMGGVGADTRREERADLPIVRMRLGELPKKLGGERDALPRPRVA